MLILKWRDTKTLFIEVLFHLVPGTIPWVHLAFEIDLGKTLQVISLAEIN